MSPIRTGCPPAHLATEFQRGSVCATMERWSSNTITFTTYAAFSRYPTSSSKNNRHIIRRKCIEHFHAEDGVLYYACGRVCERDSVHILSMKCRLQSLSLSLSLSLSMYIYNLCVVRENYVVCHEKLARLDK